MKDNKTINNKGIERDCYEKTEAKATKKAPLYDPDDYIHEYFIYDDIFFYNKNCSSCDHWRGYTCNAPEGVCIYQST